MKIVVLTGAGISAESGVRTFRDADGLWQGHRIEQVASPDGFRADPDLVHEFYNKRRAQLDDVHPNPAHRAIARLETAFADDFLLITQNVDDLHERAGSRRLIHMHGEIRKQRCTACQRVSNCRGDLGTTTPCADCGRIGTSRPHVVWFGEVPLGMDRAIEALGSCDLFVSIGTSGAVYPAAGFCQLAAAAGARTVELNLEPSLVSRHFNEARHGPAGTLVPDFVDELLASHDFQSG